MENQDGIRLNWENFQNSLSKSFKIVRSTADFSDVTLLCEDGDPIKAHRVILAAGSRFFQSILTKKIVGSHPHPLLFLGGVQKSYLEAILNFLYLGQTMVGQGELSDFMEVARRLGIIGLVERDSLPVNAEEMTNICFENKSDMHGKQVANGFQDRHSQTKDEVCIPGIVSYGTIENMAIANDIITFNIQDKSGEDLVFDQIKNETSLTSNEENTRAINYLNEDPNEMKDKCKYDMMLEYDGSLQCKVCDFIANIDDDFNEHTENHLKAYQNVWNKNSTKEVGKYPKRSAVWNFAKKIGDTAICSFCDKILAATGSTTSNIRQHIKMHLRENEKKNEQVLTVKVCKKI